MARITDLVDENGELLYPISTIGAIYKDNQTAEQWVEGLTNTLNTKIDTHVLKDITSENGVHGIRYFNDVLSYKNIFGEWVEITTSGSSSSGGSGGESGGGSGEGGNTSSVLVPWSTATEEEIATMVNAYYNDEISLDDVKSVWSVGDSRTMQLSAMAATYVGESHEAQTVELTIIGFNHDELTRSVNDKINALVTVQLKNCLNNTGYMNSTNTISGSWGACKRRKWCNDTFYNAIPSTIKSCIRKVTKTSYECGDTDDNCFLLSEIEIFGSTKYSNSYSSEGTQYEYYKTSSNRVKPKLEGNYYWWERSPWYTTYTPHQTSFCFVNDNGNWDTAQAQLYNGICPAFCL